MKRIIELNLDNVFLGTESIRQFWLIEYAIKRLSSKRIIFGSDYNLNAPSAFLGVIQDAHLNEQQRQDILYKNAFNILGLS